MKMKMKKSNHKSKRRLILERVLKKMAVLILKKYNPKIIGITGSVGKTSSKEAIFSVLSIHYRVRKNEKNYNNEIGLPLTIIGVESGESSILKWIGVFLKSLAIIIFPFEYPEVLILEMGVDRPGDMEYLTSFIKCDLAVITDISGSHLEYFGTLDGVAKEKWTLVDNLKSDGIVALNIDNQEISKLKNSKKREDLRFLTFGFSENAEIQASEVLYNYNGEDKNKKEICGLSFKLNYKGNSIPVRLNNILAEHNIYAALSAATVGIEFKINLVEIAGALEKFSLPLGRMNLLSGIKNTFIIDDTYNSSTVSAVSALKVLKNIEASRKIAVLGDMLELGEETESGHRSLAGKFLEIKNGVFFAVGERMKFASDELKKHKISEDRLFEFEDPMSAGRKLQEIIREGDLILIKGSQGIRMEKIVEEIMAESEKAGDLLCRQSETWKNKPWKKV